MSFRLCILSGTGGCLSRNVLLPLFASLNWSVVGVRHETTKEVVPDVKYVSKDAALNMAQGSEFDALLWLSPHSDVPLLRSFCETPVPVLSIGSMSIAAHLMTGAPAEHELNEYQRGKLETFRIQRLTSLFPGFYLENQPYATGLQAETTAELCRPAGDPFLNPKWDTNKIPMSVTPMSSLAQVIAQWVRDPSGTINPNTFTVFCSDGEYSRDRLRLAALGEHIQPPRNLFSNQMHPRRPDGTPWVVTHAEVEGIMRESYLKRRKLDVE